MHDQGPTKLRAEGHSAESFSEAALLCPDPHLECALQGWERIVPIPACERLGDYIRMRLQVLAKVLTDYFRMCLHAWWKGLGDHECTRPDVY